MSVGRNLFRKKTILVPEPFRGGAAAAADESMMIDNEAEKDAEPEAEPEKNAKDDTLSISNLRLSNDADTSVISNSNLSDTNEIQEFPENESRRGEKILEEMNSSTSQHFGEIAPDVMALLDDSQQAMNDSMAAADMAGPSIVTSTPSRPSNSSSASSHPSMPPLMASTTEDSGHSSASDTSDTVFNPQSLVKTQNEKDLLTFIIHCFNCSINRMTPGWTRTISDSISILSKSGRRQRSPGKKDYYNDFIFIYLLLSSLLPQPSKLLSPPHLSSTPTPINLLFRTFYGQCSIHVL